MGANPNTTGAMCTFFLTAALFQILTSGDRRRREFTLLSAASALITLYLSGCRTSYISLGCTIAVLFFVLLYRRQDSRAQRTALILGAVLLAGAAGAVVYRLLPRLALESEDIRGGSILTLGGRTRIWAAVIDALRADHALLRRGCSPASVIQFVSNLKVFYFTKANTHNQFLEILLGQGAPALGLYVLWLVLLIRKSVPLLFSSEEGSAWVLPLVLLCLQLNNLTEAMLVGQHQFTGCLYFLIAGYVSGLFSAGRRVR